MKYTFNQKLAFVERCIKSCDRIIQLPACFNMLDLIEPSTADEIIFKYLAGLKIIDKRNEIISINEIKEIESNYYSFGWAL